MLHFLSARQALDELGSTIMAANRRCKTIVTPGVKLRKHRESLHLTLRDVEVASEKIAAEFGNCEFLVPFSRLYEIESRGMVPTIYRLYSLSAIYRSDYSELLQLY